MKPASALVLAFGLVLLASAEGKPSQVEMKTNPIKKEVCHLLDLALNGDLEVALLCIDKEGVLGKICALILLGDAEAITELDQLIGCATWQQLEPAMVAVKMNPIQKEVCYLIAKGIDGDMDTFWYCFEKHGVLAEICGWISAGDGLALLEAGKLFHCGLTQQPELTMVAEAAVKTNPIQKEVCHVIELALKGDESVGVYCLKHAADSVLARVCFALIAEDGEATMALGKLFHCNITLLLPHLAATPGKQELCHLLDLAAHGAQDLGKYCMGKKGEVAALCYVLASGDVQVNYYLENKLHCNHNDGESTAVSGRKPNPIRVEVCRMLYLAASDSIKFAGYCLGKNGYLAEICALITLGSADVDLMIAAKFNCKNINPLFPTSPRPHMQ